MIMIIIHVFATLLGIWIEYSENERLLSLILNCIFSVIYINLVAFAFEVIFGIPWFCGFFERGI